MKIEFCGLNVEDEYYIPKTEIQLKTFSTIVDLWIGASKDYQTESRVFFDYDTTLEIVDIKLV